MNALRTRRPISVRMGMFWRLGVAAGHTPGGRTHLVVAGVDAARIRVYQFRQRVDVGGFELGNLAVIQDFVHHRVQALHSLQRIGVGGIAGLGAPGFGQAQLVKQQVA